MHNRRIIFFRINLLDFPKFLDPPLKHFYYQNKLSSFMFISAIPDVDLKHVFIKFNPETSSIQEYVTN